jgi:acyl carrier protein
MKCMFIATITWEARYGYSLKMIGVDVPNSQLYVNAFMELFDLTESELEALEYQGIPEWDSISHMELMTVLEKTFEIEMNIDDIIDFSSFQSGKVILAKYGVDI